MDYTAVAFGRHSGSTVQHSPAHQIDFEIVVFYSYLESEQ